MSGLIRLYPRAWRERYGDEFLALIAERPPTLRDRVDIVRGALDARLSPQLPGSDLLPDRTGFVPLAGVLSFTMGIILAVNGPVYYDEYGPYRDGAAAWPFVVLAMLAMALAMYRLVTHLPGHARAARVIAAAAIACGLLWSMAPWLLPLLAGCLIGVAVVAASSSRAGVWPTSLTVLLFVLAMIPIATIVIMLSQPWYVSRGQADLVVLLVFAPLLAIWSVIGIGLLRGFPASQPDTEAS